MQKNCRLNPNNTNDFNNATNEYSIGTGYNPEPSRREPVYANISTFKMALAKT